MEIGAQLFTLREFCQTLDGFAETLARVADIGYRTVQVSGTCAYDAAWLEQQLQKNGLRCVLTHTSPDRLLHDTDAVVAEHTVFGCDYVGLGYYAFNESADFVAFLERYRPVMRALAAQGKYFMYHNHDSEFRRFDGRTVLERLAENTAPDEMGFTLDTFWVQAGGGDPAWWLERLAGRVPCIHLKDFAYGRKMAVVGEGNLNFDRIFEKAQAADVRYMLVEQDDCGGEDPFDCLKRSYDHLRAYGFR